MLCGEFLKTLMEFVDIEAGLVFPPFNNAVVGIPSRSASASLVNA
jgi:hypothetical protein